jgi:hypothetical protein
MTKEPTNATLNSSVTRASSRLLSRLRSNYLDRQLAAGAPPGWSQSLTARARLITSTEHLRTLAENWEHLLEVSRRPAVMGTNRAPLCRDRIMAVEADIRELVDALSEARLESAPGVATASTLLRDGTGPLYNRQCQTDLAGAIHDTTRKIRHPALTGTAKRPLVAPGQ